MIQMTNEAKSFVTKHNIKSGWSQRQHVGLQASTICAALGIDTQADKDELVNILTQTVNPSQFRQKLEAANVLAKEVKKDAVSITNEYVD